VVRFGVYSYSDGAELTSQEGMLVIIGLHDRDKPAEEESADFKKYARQKLGDSELDTEDYLEMGLRLPVMKLRAEFYNRTLAAYHRFTWPPAAPALPMSPGLFQASYGPHGIEVIRLELPSDHSIKGAKGVKVIGDPNVPFDKITFEIIDGRCLDIPSDVQQTCEGIERFLEEPSYREQPQDTHIPVDDIKLDFILPEDIRDDPNIAITQKYCQV